MVVGNLNAARPFARQKRFLITRHSIESVTFFEYKNAKNTWDYCTCHRLKYIFLHAWQISASSSGKRDTDNTRLITEATTNNYLAQKRIFISNRIKWLTGAAQFYTFFIKDNTAGIFVLHFETGKFECDPFSFRSFCQTIKWWTRCPANDDKNHFDSPSITSSSCYI